MSTAIQRVSWLGIMTLLFAFLVPQASASASSTGASQVFAATNEFRVAQGQHALLFNSQLQDVAQAWAEQMAADVAGGASLDTAFRHNPDLTAQIPAGWQFAGENIAYNYGFDSPFETLVNQWKNSPGHRANMLDSRWTAFGVGVFTDADGATWGVQVFARYPTTFTPTGAIGDAYAASGGSTGPWGAPISTAAAFTSVNGPGERQNFANGQALSSASGTFFVPNSVMPTYANAGWLRGSLGWPTSAYSCGASVCEQTFQGGKIRVPVGGGPGYVVETGPIAEAYDASGGPSGPWGSPTSTVAAFTSVNGSGVKQNYTAGQALSSASGTFLVPNAVVSVWASAGWLRGPLGWPAGAAVSSSHGYMQEFQHGWIAVNKSGQGAVLTDGPITDAYVDSGGLSGSWGAPVSSVGSFDSVNGSGVKQNFTAGQALSSASGTFLVPNAIVPTWASVGWLRGSLGWPTSAYSCGASVCEQTFQGGKIRVPVGGGPGYVVETGPIAEAYDASGGPSGPWGSPTSTVAAFTSVNGSGVKQNYTAGQALSSASGTFLVPNAVVSVWASAGWLRGPLGWPAGAAVSSSHGYMQEFQHGWIAVNKSGQGAVLTDGPITDAYVDSGGLSGSWGAPVSSVGSFDSVNGSGVKQNFTAGQALSSASGTFLVPNAIVPTWASVGWLRGSLGWPAGSAVCDGSSCTQVFQHGTITAPTNGNIGTISFD